MSDCINHPDHFHTNSYRLSYTNDGPVEVSIKCKACKEEMGREFHYYRPEKCCEYYLHSFCLSILELYTENSKSQSYHPLHPQHPLTFHHDYSDSFPSYIIQTDQLEFVCSFCKKTKSSECFRLHCSQCDFYLDFNCAHSFEQNNYKILLSQYEFRHFFHCHENHTLLPHFHTEKTYSDPVMCQGCNQNIWIRSLVFKCTSCEYYLHLNCSRVPREMKHQFHPQHTLTLVERLPHEHDHDSQNLRCIACRKRIKNAFFLHCNQCSCPSFNLDIGCAFLVPNVKYDGHDHLLTYFSELYIDDEHDDDDLPLCAACNTFCNKGLYRCFTCNFNIHFECLSLPLVVDYEDHVHPLTLVNSLEEDESGVYYCDICEERRAANHGVYSCQDCEGCSFVAHFKCAINLNETEAEASSPQIPTTEDKKIEDKAEDPNLALTAYEVVSQLDMKIEKIGEMVKQLLEQRHPKEVTEKLENLEETGVEAEGMLRQLWELIYMN